VLRRLGSYAAQLFEIRPNALPYDIVFRNSGTLLGSVQDFAHNANFDEHNPCKHNHEELK